MTIRFVNTSLPAAKLAAPYSHVIEVVDGTAPYTFAVVSGSLPDGLTLNGNGEVFGTPSAVYLASFVVRATDATGDFTEEALRLTVMSYVELSNLTLDQSQFVTQFQDYLSKTKSWSYGLTTTTSQTLIELVSAVGTLTMAKLVRVREDAFPETAQSDSAILATAQMQGVRLSRKLPASASVLILSEVSQSLAPFTQFAGGGLPWFNSEEVVLVAGAPKTVILKQGEVKSVSLQGLGSDLQAWVSPEDAFVVSDQDVEVAINNATIFKSFGGLWNFEGSKAFADATMADGRLLLQFGSRTYGAVPGTNDQVLIRYAVTRGSDVNGLALVGTNLTTSAAGVASAVFTSVPSGGANERSPVAYKNFASGTFGTFGSGITKSQYRVVVSNYPGVIDAVTQAQREINPTALHWMNVIRISALTSSPWSQAQVKEYIDYVESQTMYSTRFVWQAPVPIPRDVKVNVYCLNSVSSTQAVTTAVTAAIRKLFAPRQGLLLLNIYESDIIETALAAAPGQISYVEVLAPSHAMVVTAPTSPQLTFAILPTQGSLQPAVYAYSVSVDTPSPTGVGTDVGAPANWVFPQVTENSAIQLSWENAQVPNASQYHVWGRLAGQIGKIASFPPDVTVFEDDGSIVITPESFTGAADVMIRYNTLNSLEVSTFYAARQARGAFPVREAF
jgi:hypothetical protein